MTQINLKSSHSYSILHSSLESTEIIEFIRNLNYARIYLIVDEKVWDFHEVYISSFITSLDCKFLGKSVITSGEQSKSSQEWMRLQDDLLTSSIRRNDLVLVIGGGVTGDLGAFACSTALRGLPFIHIPTTVLAMVDSAIGGKTGINHSSGKNRIGAFYQPEAVIVDTNFLGTLSKEHWLGGVGEIVKYGCISDPTLVDSLISIFSMQDWKMSRDWSYILASSAKIKAEIVEKDEKEHGIRAFLNFGHTFAHAIESVLGYGVINHGDAVFWGCIAAIHLSNMTGSDIPYDIEQLKPSYEERFQKLKKNLNTEKLISAMTFDKKNRTDEITFVLLRELGKPYLKALKDRELIKKAWDYILN